ncbi:MAG TPA: GNAT family N-acetyltransferase [Candidatus Acidoferrum sp.]|nr:GNAT family N-acetyltransferase [Candidatus Acidoferrum sp.]
MGPRIKLVRLSGRHAADLATLAADDWDVLGFVARAQRLRARGERETFAVLDARRLVGLAMFGRDPSVPEHAELGYWIGPRERGLGYATAAAEHLLTQAFSRASLKLVFAHCADANQASSRVLTKLGFRLVGVASEPTPGDETMKRYELTRSEWRSGDGST